jgi:hypothetical protein
MEAQDGRSFGGQDQWIAVDLGMAPTGTSANEWKKIDQKAKSTIQLCLSDSVLLNVSEEATSKDLWKKLGKLYQSKSLVNKLFLRKKMYNLRMRDGDSVEDHLNVQDTRYIKYAEHKRNARNNRITVKYPA